MWLGGPARSMVPGAGTAGSEGERERGGHQTPYPSSQSWLPLFLRSIPTPALAGPRGMGAGEVELAGRGQEAWNWRRPRPLESEESTAKPSRFAPTPTLGAERPGALRVGKFGKVETAEPTEKN